MTRCTKILLVLTIVNLAAAALFLADIVDVSRVPGLYVTFPFGVTLLGMFLISLMLQKEIAAYNTELLEQLDKAKADKIIHLGTTVDPDMPNRGKEHLDHAA